MTTRFCFEHIILPGLCNCWFCLTKSIQVLTPWRKIILPSCGKPKLLRNKETRMKSQANWNISMHRRRRKRKKKGNTGGVPKMELPKFFVLIWVNRMELTLNYTHPRIVEYALAAIIVIIIFNCLQWLSDHFR